VNDGVNGHVEGTVATPAGSAFDTTRMVYGRDGRRLIPVSSESGTLAATDTAGLSAGSDVVGCALSRPVF
jgi:hypothetical protein